MTKDILSQWEAEAKAYPTQILVHREAHKFSDRILALIDLVRKKDGALISLDQECEIHEVCYHRRHR